MIKTKINGKHMQTRIIPRGGNYILEIVYEIEVNDIKETEFSNIISIDLGVNNLVTIANNIGSRPIIINGKGIKSYNKYWNKQMAKYRSLSKTNNNLDRSTTLQRLTNKRNNKMDYFMHKVSKNIIDYCIGLSIDTIVIGLNKAWKQESNMNRVSNQTFVQIPYEQLINKISYKAESVGIRVIINEE